MHLLITFLRTLIGIAPQVIPPVREAIREMRNRKQMDIPMEAWLLRELPELKFDKIDAEVDAVVKKKFHGEDGSP
jgi:hypothetical protein